MGRHSDRRPLLCSLGAAAAVLGLAAVVAAGQASAPRVVATASDLPPVDPSYPVARGGPIGPLALPSIVPSDAPVWVEAKGRVIVDGRPLATPATATPEPIIEAAAPVEEPAAPVASSDFADVEATVTVDTVQLDPAPVEQPEPTADPTPTGTAGPTAPTSTVVEEPAP